MTPPRPARRLPVLAALLIALVAAVGGTAASAGDWTAELRRRFDAIDPGLYQGTPSGETADGASGRILPRAALAPGAVGALLSNLFTLTQLERQEQSAPKGDMDLLLAVLGHLYATHAALANVAESTERRCAFLDAAAQDAAALAGLLTRANLTPQNLSDDRFDAARRAQALIVRAVARPDLSLGCGGGVADAAGTVAGLVHGRVRAGVQGALSVRVRVARDAFGAATTVLDAASRQANAALAATTELSRLVDVLKQDAVSLEVNLSTVTGDKLVLGDRAAHLRQEVEAATSAADARPGAEAPWLLEPPARCGPVGAADTALKPEAIAAGERVAFACDGGSYAAVVAKAQAAVLAAGAAAADCAFDADYTTYLRSQDEAALDHAQATLARCVTRRSTGGDVLARQAEAFARELETFFGCMVADADSCKPL